MEDTSQSLHSLLEKIRKEQANFSPAERSVAAYVLENSHQVPFLSISNLAGNIGVSDNSVIRFCNGLGYSRFSEFKKDLSQRIHDELFMTKKLSNSSVEDDFLQHTKTECISIVEDTLSAEANREALEKLLEMVKDAKRIFILGGRASGFIAGYFANALRYLGLQVVDVNMVSGEFWNNFSMIQKGDMMIAISLPRYTAQVVDAVVSAHDAGIPIALITDQGLSPALPYADTAFHCVFRSDSYFPNYAGCMALISAICHAISATRKDEAAEHIRLIRKYMGKQHVFL